MVGKWEWLNEGLALRLRYRQERAIFIGHQSLCQHGEYPFGPSYQLGPNRNVPVSSWTMGSKRVEICGIDDKRQLFSGSR